VLLEVAGGVLAKALLSRLGSETAGNLLQGRQDTTAKAAAINRAERRVEYR